VDLFYCDMCLELFEALNDDLCVDCQRVLALDLTLDITYEFRAMGLE